MGGTAGRVVKGVLTGGLSELPGLLGKAPTGAGGPTPPAAPLAPSLDTAAQTVDMTDEERLRRGKASTILTGLSGETPSTNGGFLGSGG